MATYRINSKTYKIGKPTNVLEKFTCEHISFHARTIDKCKDMILHINDMQSIGVTVNLTDIPIYEEHIKWHEKYLEKYCKEYQKGF